MTSYRSRTVFCNARAPSVLPSHTRYQANVNYGLAKRVLPKKQLKRKRPERMARSLALVDPRPGRPSRSTPRLCGIDKTAKGKRSNANDDVAYASSSRMILSRSKIMRVYVMTPADELLQVEVDRHVAAGVVFSEVERRTGSLLSEYKLLYHGKWPICPLLSLTDQAVLDNSTLQLCYCSMTAEDKKEERETKLFMEMSDAKDVNIKIQPLESEQQEKRPGRRHELESSLGDSQKNKFGVPTPASRQPCSERSSDVRTDLTLRVLPDLGNCKREVESFDSTRTMNVFVKAPVGELLQLELNRTASGADLCSEVERLTGIPAADSAILRQGKWPIYPEVSLVDQAVYKDSTLELFLTLVGGGDNHEDYRDSADEGCHSLLAFHKLMIGSGTGVELLDAFLTVERKALSPEILLDSFKKAGNDGLTRHLVTFMVDLLKRRRSLNALSSCDELNKASTSDITVDTIAETFPEVDDFCEYKHKELLIALLETCPVEYHSRIISLCAQAGYPCPFLYRRVGFDGQVESRLILEAYDDLFCLPEYPLALSCGTFSTSAMGKTDLLSLLFGMSSEPQDAWLMERSPGGPCHNLSIDFAFEGVLDPTLDTFVVADVHGFSIKNSTFKIGLKVLASGATITFIHVTSKNFTDRGEPDDEVKEIVKGCCDVLKDRKSRLMILWRDFTQQQAARFAVVQQKMPQALTCLKNSNVMLGYFQVPDLRSLRERRVSTLAKELTSATVEILACGRRETLPRMATAIEMAAKRRSLSTCGDETVAVNSIFRRVDSNFESISSTLHDILNTAKDEANAASPSKALFEVLFPAASLDSRLAALEERGQRLTRQEVLEDDFKHKISEIESQLRQTEKEKLRCRPSHLVKYFSIVVASEDLTEVQEFDRQLCIWKSPLCSPLFEERTKLHRQLEEKLMKLRDEGKGTEPNTEVEDIHAAIKRNSKDLERIEISTDDVWSELMSLSGKIMSSKSRISLLEKECGIKPAVVHAVFQQWVLSGNPVQLLRGYPLYMSSDFLSAVLRRIQQQQHGSRKLFVVSVIGMQSSAKSTLLNYLFGCGFATRAGRCTKGLYASYMRTQEFDILILDSEGLMSVEGGSKEFDNELALMIMACSHIVIINQKGEIHRQLRELLEVALFAMKHLEVLKLKPDIVFVLRDQADFDLEALKTQFVKMGQTLTEHADKLKLQISKFVNLSPDALHLFPSAFVVQERKGKKLKQPAGVFSNMVLKLRGELFKRQETKFGCYSAAFEEFSTMEHWIVHARTVWTAIRKFGGNLVYYESMQEIEQRSEVSAIFGKIVEEEIESEEGFNAQCHLQLKHFVSSDKKLVASGDAGNDLRQAVDNLEASVSANIGQRLETELKRGKYPQHFRLVFQAKLQRRINETKQTVMAAWFSYETSVREKVQSTDLEIDLVKTMKTLFESADMSDRKSKMEANFELEWTKKLGTVERQMERSVMSDRDLQNKINFLFVEQVTNDIEKEVFVLLNTKLTGIPAQQSLMLGAYDEERWNQYLKVNKTLFPKFKDLFWSSGREAKARKECIAQCRQTVNDHFTHLSRHFSTPDWQLDNSFMGRLMQSTVTMVKSLGSKLHGLYEVMQLQTSLFANDVHDCLRTRIYNEYRHRQDNQQRKKLSDLQQLKTDLKQKILTRLSVMEDDSLTATCLAVDIKFSIVNDWLTQKATLFQAKVEQLLRYKFGSAKDAAEHAFEESFLREDWKAVVRYCTNPTEFLESIFEKRFDRISDEHRVDQLKDIRKTLLDELSIFYSLVKSWGVDMSSNDRDTTTMQSFLQHCQSRSSVSSRDRHYPVLNLTLFVSPTYTIKNRTEFVPAFLAATKRLLDIESLEKEADKILYEKLYLVKCHVWETTKGCSDTCPLCGAKCSLESDHLLHQKHECHIHLFQAFNGRRNLHDKSPVFQVCNSKKAMEDKTYIDRNGTFHNLCEYYRLFYPNWKVQDTSTLLEQELHLARLRRAWVNTRAVFLRLHPGINDTTSVDWIRMYRNNPLPAHASLQNCS